MSDTIMIAMKVTANEKTAVNSRTISRADEARVDSFDLIDFAFGQLAAPLKDMALPLLDDRYDGPVTVEVESRDGDKVSRNVKTVLNSRLKQIVAAESLRHGIAAYGTPRQVLEKGLVDALFDGAMAPVIKSLKEGTKSA